MGAHLHFSPKFDGPSFVGLSFDLISAIGKSNHKLTIATQTAEVGNRAFITGTWQGNPASPAKPIEGVITDRNGSFSIDCNWAKVAGDPPDHFLTGTLTFQPAQSIGRARDSSSWLLEGTVTVDDSTGTVNPSDGPGPVSGIAPTITFPAI
jgi:hypothetical protein